jgi:hypothetical protein
LLTKKVENFKKYLKEEDEMRHKVKETFYYWQFDRFFFVFLSFLFYFVLIGIYCCGMKKITNLHFRQAIK